MANAVSIPNSAPRERRALTFPMHRPTVIRIVLCVLIAAALAAVYVAQTHVENRRQDSVAAARGQAGAALAAARAAGVPMSALAADVATMNRLGQAQPPARVLYFDSSRLDFWDHQRVEYLDLATAFAAAPAVSRESLRSRISAGVASARVAVADWTSAGADPGSTSTVTAAIDRVSVVSAQLTDLRALDGQLAIVDQALAAAASGLATQREDNQAQATFLARELPTATADLTAEHKRAEDLTTEATNNADAANHYGVAGADILTTRLQHHHASAAAATNPQDLAAAVAWLLVDAGRLEKVMAAGMPAKAIYVSVGRQEMRAYEAGKLVRQSLVTTGRPELPTDIGSFSVLRKNHPWTMQSPFPRSSPFWYPDTVVQYVLWFNDDGSGLHDAYWRSRFGPGTNGPGRSGGTHGCINMPYDVTVWMYDWAPVGTPVTVG